MSVSRLLAIAGAFSFSMYHAGFAFEDFDRACRGRTKKSLPKTARKLKKKLKALRK